MTEHPATLVADLLSEDRGISVGVMYPGDNVSDGIPLIRVGDVGDFGINRVTSFRISEAVHREYQRTELDGGECLITLVGRPGQAFVVPNDMAGWNVARALAVVRLRDPSDARFFVYALKAPAVLRTIENWCNTTVQPTLNLKEIRALPIPWPSKTTRDEIAEALGALDNKIELNRRMNETLEAMAQAIFRDWFVDFGPVRRKLAGEHDPNAIMGGLAPDPSKAAELAAVFSDAVDDENSPVGWIKGRANDLIEFNPSEPLRKGVIAFYTDMSSLPTRGSVAEAPIMREFGSGMRFRNDDALLARITPCLENGKTAFVDYLGHSEVGWGSTEFIVMRARAPAPKPLAYLLARDVDFRRHAIQSMTGTSGRQRAQADALENWPMAVAPDQVLQAFGNIVVPLFQRITAAGAENRTLAETRDYLLPRLMSGKLRGPDAIAEAAA